MNNFAVRICVIMSVNKFFTIIFLWVCASVATQASAQTEVIVDSTANVDCADFEVFADSTTSAHVIRPRLKALENIFPLHYHAVTHQYIDIFRYKKAYFVKRMLEQSPLYFQLYDEMLEKYNLPNELKYLSLIESGLNPRIISYASAGGLWQFMPATGRELGLRQDSHVDERFDPYRATEAACKYLRQLYRMFGDWEMALAAYNTGPGNVKRAMRRSGEDTFWGIYEYLPHQTRMYVPQFVAMIYMMNYHADYNIFPEAVQYNVPHDTIQTSGYFNLFKFAALADVSLDDFYKLNPHIIGSEFPAHYTNYAIRVPANRLDFVRQNRVAIFDSASRRPFDSLFMLAKTNDATPTPTDDLDPEDQKAMREATAKAEVSRKLATKPRIKYHKVQHGDTLWSISERYGISYARLKKLNRLKGSVLKKGQKLLIS
jgi:membrane-bound lytic murein transglycosylase D